MVSPFSLPSFLFFFLSLSLFFFSPVSPNGLRRIGRRTDIVSETVIGHGGQVLDRLASRPSPASPHSYSVSVVVDVEDDENSYDLYDQDGFSSSQLRPWNSHGDEDSGVELNNAIGDFLTEVGTDLAKVGRNSLRDTGEAFRNIYQAGKDYRLPRNFNEFRQQAAQASTNVLGWAEEEWKGLGNWWKAIRLPRSPREFVSFLKGLIPKNPEEWSELAISLVPLVNSAHFAEELLTGKDPRTGQPTDRLLAAAMLVMSAIPGSGLTKQARRSMDALKATMEPRLVAAMAKAAEKIPIKQINPKAVEGIKKIMTDLEQHPAVKAFTQKTEQAAARQDGGKPLLHEGSNTVNQQAKSLVEKSPVETPAKAGPKPPKTGLDYSKLPAAVEGLGPAEVVKAFQSSGKKVITFVGYSGTGYESVDSMLAIARKELSRMDPKRHIVNIGGTEEGIGAVYKLAKEMGFETSGIVSSQAKVYNSVISQYCDRVFYITDDTWGGYMKTDLNARILADTSKAMVSASEEIIGIGGGPVGRDELLASLGANKKVKYFQADMNHQIAIDKAAKSGLPPPTPEDFKGAASVTEKRILYKAKTQGSPIKNSSPAMMAQRKDFARKFYERHGMNPSEVDSHLGGIALENPVRAFLVPKGKKLYQWCYKDANGNPKIGKYYSPKPVNSDLGLGFEGRYLVELEVEEAAMGLQSIAKDIPNWAETGLPLEERTLFKGGATQIYSPDLKVKNTRFVGASNPVVMAQSPNFFSSVQTAGK